MGHAEFLDKILPGLGEAIQEVVTDFNLALHALVSLNRTDISFSLKLAAKVPTQFGPTAVGAVGFGLDVGTSSCGITVRLDFGAGVGAGFGAGPSHALPYFGVTQSVYKNRPRRQYLLGYKCSEQAEWENSFKGRCTVAELSASLAGP